MDLLQDEVRAPELHQLVLSCSYMSYVYDVMLTGVKLGNVAEVQLRFEATFEERCS